MIKFTAFAVVDGVPTMRDSDLARLYDMLVEDRAYRWVFFDKSVLDASEFVALAKRGPFAVAWFDGRIAGFFWLSDFHGKTARIHFVIFKEFRGAAAKALGRQALVFVSHLARNGGGLKSLLGFIPAHNHLAMKFAVDIGMARCGEIKHYFHDAFDDELVSAALFQYEIPNEGV